MEIFSSAAHASAAAADHAADTALHAAASARSASAASQCAAAAAGAVAKHSCPASTEQEEDTEIDVELGTLDSSSTFSSSTPTSSSSSTSTLQNFKEKFAMFRSWSGVIYELVLTAFMGVPVYPSYNHIRKKPTPPFLIFFILYSSIWICVNTGFVFLFLGRSKKEKRISLWMYRLYMMGISISMVLYIYFLIPHTYGVNLGAGILIASIVLAHMTAWNIRLTYPCSSNGSNNNLEG